MSGWFDYLGFIAKGAWVTLEVSFVSCCLGFLVAFAAGLARVSREGLVRAIATAYVEFFRGTSIYVQLFWAYYVLPIAGIGLTAFQAAVLALSLNAGAYGSETVRAAIRSVSAEQRAACVALNLTRWQTLRHVVLPQALLAMLPSLGNLAIEVLKGTAVTSLISISDLTFQAQTVRAATGNTVMPFLTIFAVYFAFASMISLGFQMLERRLARGHEGIRV